MASCEDAVPPDLVRPQPVMGVQSRKDKGGPRQPRVKEHISPRGERQRSRSPRGDQAPRDHSLPSETAQPSMQNSSEESVHGEREDEEENSEEARKPKCFGIHTVQPSWKGWNTV